MFFNPFVTLNLFQCWDLSVNTFFFLSPHLLTLDFLQKNSPFMALYTLTSQDDDDNEDARYETEEGTELHDSWQHYQQVKGACHVLRKV